MSRYLFAFCALLALLFAFAWLLADRRTRKDRLSRLPGAGTVGELVVLSGGRELKEQTWYPVPREGVLGSVRSCDLVVPCGGVKPFHLDFSWQDGTGLLISPRSGCEVVVNGAVMDCRSDPSAFPLSHGGCLQVGSAVLRLQLFAALDPFSANRQPGVEAPAYPVAPMPAFTAAPAPVSSQVQQFPPQVQPFPPAVPYPPVNGAFPAPPAGPQPVEPPAAFAQEQAVPAPVPGESASAAAPRKRRADHWKEDWSE